MPGSGVTSPDCALLEISVEDWDCLFCAVAERLTHMVDERSAATDLPRLHDMRGSVRETVLECVAALDQLHEALTLERKRFHLLEPATRGRRLPGTRAVSS